MKQITLIALVLISNLISARTIYTATTGNNSNAGTSGSPYKTIAYAATQSTTNDTIIVAAGTYTNEVISCKASTTFIGVNKPLIKGSGRDNGLICFNVIGNYVKINGFKISDYTYGVNNGSYDYCVFLSIRVDRVGSVTNSYSGRGIQLGSYGTSQADYNYIVGCTVMNSAAEGISVNGNYNKVVACYVACNENVSNAATDYYMPVTGNNNTIDRCMVRRFGNLSHYGHGIGFKYDCLNNLVKDCKSYSMAECYYVRHRGVKNNTFSNCKSYDANGGGYAVRDGASYNSFTNCTDSNSYGAIRFFDTTEDGGATYVGRHNTFSGCVFQKDTVGLYFDGYNVVSTCDSNLINNCTFKNIHYFSETSRANTTNTITGCQLINVKQKKAGSFSLNVSASSNTYTNTPFTLP